MQKSKKKKSKNDYKYMQDAKSEHNANAHIIYIGIGICCHCMYKMIVCEYITLSVGIFADLNNILYDNNILYNIYIKCDTASGS